MSLSSITVECRKCGHAFPVPRTLIVTGNWQRGCPVCYPPHEPPDAAATTPTDRQTIEQETPNGY